MNDLIKNAFRKAIVTDPAMQAFWSGAAASGAPNLPYRTTPQEQAVRLHYDLPDRDEDLPYAVYLMGGPAYTSEWPVRDHLLNFSVYDLYSSAGRAFAIADRLCQICANRVWYPIDDSGNDTYTADSAAARTWGVRIAPKTVSTQNKLATRVDFALSIRWYDSKVAASAVLGATR